MKNPVSTIGAVGLLVGLGVVAASCGGEQREPMTPAARVATPVTPAEAVDEIADARCAHEQRCNNIGMDKEFQSHNHCMQVMRADASESLSDGCENGVSRNDLQQCLSEISNQDCGGVASVFDELDTFLSCRSGALCLD